MHLACCMEVSEGGISKSNQRLRGSAAALSMHLACTVRRSVLAERETAWLQSRAVSSRREPRVGQQPLALEVCSYRLISGCPIALPSMGEEMGGESQSA